MHILMGWTLSQTFLIFPLVWLIAWFSKFVWHPPVAWFCTNWKDWAECRCLPAGPAFSPQPGGLSTLLLPHTNVRLGLQLCSGLVDCGGGFGCRWWSTGASSWRIGWVEIVSLWTWSFASWILKPALGSNFEQNNPRVLDRVWEKLQK